MHLGNLTYQKSSHKIIFGFALISIIVIIVVFYTTFSKAEIVLKLRREKIDSNFNVSVNKNSSLATAISGRVISQEIEGSEKTNEIKEKQVDDYAHGKVTVYNKLAKSLTLVAGSQLKSADSNIIYKTQGALILKPKSQTEMEVIATTKGKDGELSPTKFNFVKLWPGWSDLVYAENKKQFMGGQKNGRIVTENDINSLREKLAAELFDQGLKDLVNETEDNEEVWDRFFKTEIINFKLSHNLGEEAKDLEGTLKLKLTGSLINKEMLNNVAEAKIKNQIIGNEEFEALDEQSLNAEIIEIDAKKNSAEYKIKVTAFLKPIINDEIVNKENILGMTSEELREYYKQFQEEIENVDISFSPFWQKKVPGNIGNVEIIVK